MKGLYSIFLYSIIPLLNSIGLEPECLICVHTTIILVDGLIHQDDEKFLDSKEL